jgi:hypothetical protein
VASGSSTRKEEPGLRRRLVLAGLILIPIGALLLSLDLDVAGTIAFAGGWALALLPILLVPVEWLRGRQADAPFRRMPWPTFILATGLAGITIGAKSPEAGVAIGYIAVLWFYARWTMS